MSGQQAHHHRPLITNPVDDLRRRYGENKICSKKGKLNEHNFFVIEVENRLQVRDKNVVETRQKAPHEKQRSHYRQRNSVGSRPFGADVVVELPGATIAIGYGPPAIRISGLVANRS